MAVREVVQIGHPALKAKNKTIANFNSPKVKQLIKDLVDTMREEELIGVAAPQIGENLKIFVTEPRKTKTRTGDQVDQLRVYINPAIIFLSKAQTIIYEGCGSVAKGTIFGPVKRPEEITIEAIDEKGKKFKLNCNGILARVIQHEYDHLQGVEFTEKVTDYQKLIDVSFYKKYIKNSKQQKRASKITKILVSYERP